MATVEKDRESKGTLEIAVFRRARKWAAEVQDDLGARRVPLVGERLVVGSSAAADVVVSDATSAGSTSR